MRKLRGHIAGYLLTVMLSAPLPFQHPSTFSIPVLLHKHWFTLTLCCSFPPSFLWQEVSSWSLQKKDILKQTGSESEKDPGGPLCELVLSQPFPKVQCSRSKGPQRHREGDTSQTSKAVTLPLRHWGIWNPVLGQSMACFLTPGECFSSVLKTGVWVAIDGVRRTGEIIFRYWSHDI